MNPIAMKIFVKARPGARQPRIEEKTGLFGKKGERHFVVAVKECAVAGRANRAIERAVAEYFGVAPSRVSIVVGNASRDKVVEIAGKL